MDVHLRSAFHPLLGRLRSGAPRLWPLSPELHTADCSFACPGSSTWVDKVPSRDTPTLDLSDCQSDPNSPQVAQDQSSTYQTDEQAGTDAPIVRDDIKPKGAVQPDPTQCYDADPQPPGARRY